jgi:hypothetical protein
MAAFNQSDHLFFLHIDKCHIFRSAYSLEDILHAAYLESRIKSEDFRNAACEPHLTVGTESTLPSLIRCLTIMGFASVGIEYSGLAISRKDG